MSDGILKKTELLANVAIIVVALLLGGVLVKRYLWPGGAADAPRADPRIPAGTRATLPGVDWAANGRTLLLVLSRDCRYCTESAPFYRNLAREAEGRAGVRLIAVFPQEVAEGRKYLADLGVSVHEVRQAAPSSTGAGGTPTLILVDEGGVVRNSWVGKLAAPEESEVLKSLEGEAPGGARSG
jgi:peroxiredoxin